MADIFENNAPEIHLEDHVGEDKKFKSVEDLLKGKLEADRTIESRNQELEAHRQEIRRLMEEAELLRATREPKAEQPPRDADRPVEEKPEKDLATRIREELQAQQEEDRKTQNLVQSVNKLEQVYGDRAREVLQNKAAELGVSVDFLKDVAARSPKAFFAQIGLEDSPNASAPATRGDVNPAALADTRSSTAVKEGTYAFYEKIRKDNPKLYFTAEIQNRMFSDAKRLGDAFYS